jgi:2-dehydro-3-deoxyphosphogluconate aldolase/(4S)-4-hydroxy-2-oxoglutarate aldolase
MEGALETAGLPPALAAIGRAAVVPVVREDDAERAVEVARWAVEQGLDVVELTATIPDWRAALRELREHAPGVTLGVGTLRSRADAEAAVAEGAEFLVTPHPAPDVRAVADAHGIPLIGGGFTPAEVLEAAERGVAKLFPAHVGGIAFLRSLLALAPRARVVPTGGIALTDVPEWLAAGSFAVGVGSELRPGNQAAADLRTILERRG